MVVKTYRIAHLEHKLAEGRELLAKLVDKLPPETRGSIWVTICDLRRALSEDDDVDLHVPPADEQRWA